MPKTNHEENKPLIDKIEQKKSPPSYDSIEMKNTNSAHSNSPCNNDSSNQPCTPVSYFFKQQFKEDFSINDFSGSLHTFKFYEW